jgi:transaldolase
VDSASDERGTGGAMSAVLEQLRVKIFADGADRKAIAELAAHPVVSGFTTNPTLMRASGVDDYEAFAREIVELVPELPISFEVFSDDFDEMEQQARIISQWGQNVFVKVPVTNTRGESSAEVVRHLVAEGFRLNVTALTTVRQVEEIAAALSGCTAGFVSVFAGRIADTGVDPSPIIAEAVGVLRSQPQLQLIWASPREVLNILHADAVGCHVITVTQQLLAKLPWLGRDLEGVSLDTVRMFHDDARAANYSLAAPTLSGRE